MNINLDKRCQIDVPVITLGDYGEPLTAWALLATVWCNVQDDLPSKSEAVQQGLVVNKSRARIRFRHLATVTSACRITVRGATDRVFAILGGPAAIGDRGSYMEVYAETSSS
ncbi:MAG: head-tail adaptor protein [Sterolibacterium sp.]